MVYSCKATFGLYLGYLKTTQKLLKVQWHRGGGRFVELLGKSKTVLYVWLQQSTWSIARNCHGHGPPIPREVKHKYLYGLYFNLGFKLHSRLDIPSRQFCVVGENPTPYGILALWAVNGLSILCWDFFIFILVIIFGRLTRETFCSLLEGTQKVGHCSCFGASPVYRSIWQRSSCHNHNTTTTDNRTAKPHFVQTCAKVSLQFFDNFLLKTHTCNGHFYFRTRLYHRVSLFLVIYECL